MKNTRYLAGLLTGGFAALLVLTPGPASAAFEDVEVSPRTRAMGGAFNGLQADVYAPLHNAASLGYLEKFDIAGSFQKPFGLDYSSQGVITGGGMLPGKWGGIGVAIRRFAVDFQGEDLTGETTVALGYGVRILQDLQSELSLGITANWYSLSYGLAHDDTDPGSAGAIAVDLSAMGVIAERTTVGFFAQNVTNTRIGSLDKEELRRRVGVGVGYRPYRGVQTLLDIFTEQGEDVQYRGGAEFQAMDFLWLRGGVRTGPNVVTAGVGFDVRGIRLDYAFSSGGGVLDSTHHIGLAYSPPDGR
jgi:hypothetical protein